MADVTAVPRASENNEGGGTTFPVCRSGKSSRESWRLTRLNIRLTDVFLWISDEKNEELIIEIYNWNTNLQHLIEDLVKSYLFYTILKQIREIKFFKI